MGLIESIDKLSAWLKRRREAKRLPIVSGRTWGGSSRPFWTTEPAAVPAIPVPMKVATKAPLPRKVPKVTHEARKWLASNPAPDPFWTDHFRTKANAQNLVANLYHAGASSVRVGSLIRDNTGEYASSLLVRAPKGKKRLAVQQILKRHHPDRLSLVKGTFKAWWD